MDVTTRNREELKSYFLKNSIPTEGNFAELIDGSINQNDDGVVKQPGSPLSIQAAGDAGSMKPTLAFYNSFDDDTAEWSLTLNPRQDPNNAGTAQRGLGFTDGEGNTHLFIDRSAGRVSIGLAGADPNYHFLVRSPNQNNSIFRSTGTNTAHIIIDHNEGWDNRIALVNRSGGHFAVWVPNGGDAFNVLKNGNVGVGTGNPSHKFHVQTGNAVGLFESTGNQAYLRLHHNEGINNRVEIASRPGGRLALWVAGKGDVFNITRDGKIGIGLIDPVMPFEMQLKPNVHRVGITQNQIGGSATMELTTADSAGNQASRIVLRGNDDNTDIEFYSGSQAAPLRRFHFSGSNGNLTMGKSMIIFHGGSPAANEVVGGIGFLGYGQQHGQITLRVRRGFEFTNVSANGPRLNYNTNTYPYMPLYAGKYNQESSREVKEDIHNLTSEDALQALAELQPVKFRYVNAMDNKYDIGFIAEDVPELVASSDRRTVSPMDMIAVLTKVVQEQQHMINTLQRQLQ